MSIEALSKPRQKLCEHCNEGKGCRIYEKRPTECRTFHCGYLIDDKVRDHWKPAACHMVLAFDAAAKKITLYVEDTHIDAWRQEPYISQIRQWAADTALNGGQVIVCQGPDVIALLPDKEKNLGHVREGQVIITGRRKSPSGPVFDAIVLEGDDPRLQKIRSENAGGENA